MSTQTNVWVKHIQKHYDLSDSLPECSRIHLTPSMRSALYDELLSSKYANKDTLHTYIDNALHINRYITPHFQVDIWIEDEKDIPIWDCTMQKVCKRLEALYSYFDSKMPRLFYDCIPMDIHKNLPSNKNTCVTTENVNGGYTYLNSNRIVLFRREELPKVMLHEYLHQVQGNADIRWTSKQLNDLYLLWNISYDGCSNTMNSCTTDVRINEAFVELWAWWFQIVFLSIETGIDFTLLYDIEVQFAYCQARKLYDHQTNCTNDKKAVWSEDTHSFSYHVLKAFLIWLVAQGITSLDNLTLDYSSDEIVGYIHTFWGRYLSSVLKKKTKKDISFKCPVHPYGVSTLRMTLLGDF